jgi:hypothetical protein
MSRVGIDGCPLLSSSSRRSSPRRARGAKVGSMVDESAKTGGQAIPDGFLTFGRTMRAFFKGGRGPRRRRSTRTPPARGQRREGARPVEGEANR